eukprot:TRINITY_DN25358_c0_g1_i1.p1 TRINITY_DN25358_c0_g1~~TRINITY_DN25358_c0_g1_i1.p1  ORF type:complete len:1032 (+),score=122.03 TRINITY_DN25358_c0_g1_i1:45-3140(+)
MVDVRGIAIDLMQLLDDRHFQRLRQAMVSGIGPAEFVGLLQLVWHGSSVSLPPLPRRGAARTVQSDTADVKSRALFSAIDHASTNRVTWEAFMAYLIDAGMRGRLEEDLPVDKYLALPVADRRGTGAEAVRRATFIPALDRIMVLARREIWFLNSQFQEGAAEGVHAVSFPDLTAEVMDAAFVPPLHCLVTCSTAMRMEVYNIPSRRWMRPGITNDASQTVLRWDDAHGVLLSGSRTGSVSLWDLHEMTSDGLEPIGTLHGVHRSDITAIAPFGEHIATGSTDGYISILEWPEGNLALNLLHRFSPLPGRQTPVNSLGYLPGYNFLVAGTLEPTPLVWVATASGRVPAPFVLSDHHMPHKHAIAAVCAGSASEIVSLDAAGILKFWDVRTFGCFHTAHCSNGTRVEGGVGRGPTWRGVLSVPGTRRVLAYSHRHLCGFGSPADAAALSEANPVLGLGVEESGTFASGGCDVPIGILCHSTSKLWFVVYLHGVKVWQAEAGQLGRGGADINLFAAYSCQHKDEISAFCLNSAGRVLYTVAADGTVCASNASNGNLIEFLPSIEADVTRLLYYKSDRAADSRPPFLLAHHWDGSVSVLVLCSADNRQGWQAFERTLQENRASAGSLPYLAIDYCSAGNLLVAATLAATTVWLFTDTSRFAARAIDTPVATPSGKGESRTDSAVFARWFKDGTSCIICHGQGTAYLCVGQGESAIPSHFAVAAEWQVASTSSIVNLMTLGQRRALMVDDGGRVLVYSVLSVRETPEISMVWHYVPSPPAFLTAVEFVVDEVGNPAWAVAGCTRTGALGLWRLDGQTLASAALPGFDDAIPQTQQDMQALRSLGSLKPRREVQIRDETDIADDESDGGSDVSEEETKITTLLRQGGSISSGRTGGRQSKAFAALAPAATDALQAHNNGSFPRAKSPPAMSNAIRTQQRLESILHNKPPTPPPVSVGEDNRPRRPPPKPVPKPAARRLARPVDWTPDDLDAPSPHGAPGSFWETRSSRALVPLPARSATHRHGQKPTRLPALRSTV